MAQVKRWHFRDSSTKVFVLETFLWLLCELPYGEAHMIRNWGRLQSVVSEEVRASVQQLGSSKKRLNPANNLVSELGGRSFSSQAFRGDCSSGQPSSLWETLRQRHAAESRPDSWHTGLWDNKHLLFLAARFSSEIVWTCFILFFFTFLWHDFALWVYSLMPVCVCVRVSPVCRFPFREMLISLTKIPFISVLGLPSSA